MKKQLLLIFAILLPLLASAQTKIDDLWYNLFNDQTAEVAYEPYGRGYSGDVIVPSVVSHGGVDYNVTGLGDDAFRGSTSLLSVTLPPSITSIGSTAFFKCNTLNSIIIQSAKLSSVGYRAFDTCTGSLTINCDIPSASELYYGAFYNAMFTNVTIGEGVTSIGRYAFQDCKKLSSIAIPESVSNIGYYAFYGCSNLQSVNIPEGVTNIEASTFYGCSSLTSIIIPEGVAAIGGQAFYGCSNLSSITFPKSLTSIGDNAFFRCSSLASITIPENMAEIGIAAFFECSSLATITCHAVTPPTLNSSAFSNVDTTIPVYVPAESVEAYKSAYGWRNFENFQSIPSSDIASGACGDNLTWRLTEEYELVIEGTGDMYDYTQGGTPWNEYRDAILTITLPEGVTSIGEYAFSDCSSLTSITIPENVASIGESAFQFCSSLISLTIPMSTTSIGKAAFSCCSSLTSIIVTEGNTIYDSREGCNAIIETSSNTLVFGCSTTIIPESVTSIGEAAFSRCYNLASIIIPKDVTSIGSYAFDYCTSLTSITCNAATPPTAYSSTFYRIDNSIPVYVPAGSVEAYHSAAYWSEFANIKGVVASGTCGDNLTWKLTEEYELIIEGTGEMYDYASSEEVPWYEYREMINMVILPDGLTSIGRYAFYGCSSLTSIILPESIVSIGEHAFEGSSSLTSITIPKSVTSIGYDAFWGCKSLTSITIPEGVASIGERAFCACNLICIYIPASVTSIGEGAFANNPNLAEIVVNQGNSYYDSRNNCNAIIEKANGQLVAGCTSTLIPEGVTTIGYGAFCVSNLSSIDIPKSVTSIGDYAFNYCSSLTAITLPEGLTSIGEWAFDGCSSLTTITCNAATPPTIYPSTFLEVDKSIPVYVPAGSVEAYKAAAYWSEFTNYQPLSSDIASGTCGDNLMWKLTEEYELVIEGTGEMYDFDYNSIPWHEYRESIQAITIAEGVTSIGHYVFYECNNLTAITIPEGVMSIGNCAFAGCDNLTAITLPESVTSIGEDAFYSCSSLTAITIPEGVTSIGGSAFSGCSSLTTITIPEGVTSIGENAFQGCSSLTAITLPEGMTSIGNYAFYNCTRLTAITLPASVMSIGNYAFYYCENLTAINIPEGVTSIGYAAFNKCSSLTTITIPESVTSIGYYAFQFCSSLISLTIPMSTTSIGEAAFSCCSSLTSIIVTEGNTIYDSREGCNAIIETSSNTLVFGCSTTIIPESVTSIGGAAFSRCYNLASIIIPKDVTSIGNYAFDYCTSLTSITCNAATPPTIDYPSTFVGVDKSIPVYVPAGSVEAYQSAEYWNEFANIKGVVASGTCGDNLTWKLTEEYELVIEGTGDMYDYTQGGTPWSEYRDEMLAIALPEGVTSIGNRAFEDCGNLTSIIIPESVASIGEHAFSGCSGLTALTIPESVTSIEGWAFLDCSSLTSITIPANVINIGYGILMGCNGLVSVVVEVGNPVYDSRYNCNAIIETSSNTLVGGCSITVIPNDITSIGNRAFGYCDFATISIPKSVKTIEDYAFGRSYLTSITLPEGVTSIGREAFAFCENLASITIPGSVTSIGTYAFNACYALTEVHISSIEAWCKISFSEVLSNPLVYAHNLYLNGELVTELVIPDGVTSIGDCAFCYCSSLTAITSETTTPPTIGGPYAFYGVDKSIPVYVPAGSVVAYKAAEYWSEFTNILPIEEPTPDYVTITISKYGSGTYSSAYALDFSEVQGLKAYVATGYNYHTGVVTLLRVHTADAATGLLVKGTPGASYEVPVMEYTADRTLNMLVPTLERTEVDSHSSDGVYANYKYTVDPAQNPDEPLFYPFADNSHLSAGKAYLQIPVVWLPATGQKSIRYRFDEGETTDIEDEEIRNQKSEIIYDLYGRRVVSPKKGEIYIINNQKIVY